MRLRRKYMRIFPVAFFMTVGMLSCVSHRGGSPDNELETVAEDTLATDNPEPEPEAPYYSFMDSGEALTFMKESGHWEEYSRGILPQMAEDELVYAEKLLNNSHDGFVVVDKSRMKVIKFNRYGVEEVSFGMACAKNYGTKHKRRDSRTPEGFFSVKKIHNSTDWHYVDDDGVRSEKTGEFGPRFIRLNIPVTTQIGIHGTCAPWSIGGRRSHGCIRIKNEDIMKLVEMVDSGMPVIVTPGRRDMEVNREEGFDIPSISSVPGKPRLVLKSPSASDSRAMAMGESDEQKAVENIDSVKSECDTVCVAPEKEVCDTVMVSVEDSCISD